MASFLSVSAAASAATPLTARVLTIDTEISTFNVAAWWSPVAHDAKQGDTYLGYLKPKSQPGKRDDVWVARVSRTGDIMRSRIGADALHDAGHTQVSLALDGAGGLHVFSGMHGGPIQYRFAKQPTARDAEFTPLQPAAFAGGDFTYPNLTTDREGDVWMIIRDYPAGRLFHYSTADALWTDVGAFAKQAGSTVYPDQVVAGPDGQIHLIWEWAAGHPQATRHLGTYARFDPKTKAFFRADGTAFAKVDVPFRPTSGDVYQPLEARETYVKDVHGVQSAKMTLDDAARPVIAYSYSVDGTATAYTHRLARWDGTQWSRTVFDPGPYELNKPWISYVGGTLRAYGTVSSDHPASTGTQDLFVRTSQDLGQTWSDPVPLTRGLNIQRPIGIQVAGVDYLFLPDLTSKTLYLAIVR